MKHIKNFLERVYLAFAFMFTGNRGLFDRMPKDNPLFKFETDGLLNNKGQIKFLMDWNTDFIEVCRQQGFSGLKEEEIVEQYLGYILMNILGISADEVDEIKTEHQLESSSRNKVIK